MSDSHVGLELRHPHEGSALLKVISYQVLVLAEHVLAYIII